ncbi:MAG TPA: hypothetical protein VIV60_10585, partial [Polyangiaceae bacterium]
MSEPDPFESLLAPLRASFHAKRRERLAMAEQISRCLEAYVRAVDTEILQELGKTHGIGAKLAGDPPSRLAAELRHLVALLPELQASEAVAMAPKSSSQPSPESSPAPLSSMRTTFDHAPLVIVGGPPHLERLRSLPEDLLPKVEWVDTTRQGTHAIGNLERRIRDNRIGAMLILEGLVLHRHTDPLVSAARSVSLPLAFAGKGGRSALTQAIEELA